ncbi:4Fe-4S dicluster domain-containing protein [Agrobacterium vitis]|uniref:4Fe-4S dicluster domain-containing protein n=1 Tax=Agrobacterium vitis TaxID=373 RepID=A0A6L6VEU0_AGRVI|nr:Coenzyme F420 hydrogenase/dehydrogenase, beta subunit C-terminal domain [Agrobacterium vitis]MUZ74096.1 4Fe-4S dicluster domain-containing protein [Agrobacterium vitis]
MSIRILQENVLDSNLCAGCGACQLVCPEQLVVLHPDTLQPVLDFDPASCGDCHLCHDVCPGADPGTDAAEMQLFGRERQSSERWLGIHIDLFGARSTRADVFEASASGGTVTTLLLASRSDGFGVDHVLTMGRNPDAGWRAKGVVSGDEETIIANAQSTYQLAPYLAELRGLYEHCRNDKIAVVGLACHMQAIRKLQQLQGDIADWARENIILLIETACSSSTLPKGTADIVEGCLNLPLDAVSDLRYRSGPYPGKLTVSTKDGGSHALEFWQILKELKGGKNHRCLSCGDWMSGLADISVCDGDPNIFDASINGTAFGKYGRVLVRTPIGQKLADYCRDEGLLEQWPIDLEGFNLGLERKRNRRRSYEAGALPVPQGPSAPDIFDPEQILSDEALIDPKRYKRG